MTSHCKMSFQMKAAFQPLSSEMIDTADRSSSRDSSRFHFARKLRRAPLSNPLLHTFSHVRSHVSKRATAITSHSQSTTYTVSMQNIPLQTSHVSHVSVPTLTTRPRQEPTP